MKNKKVEKIQSARANIVQPNPKKSRRPIRAKKSDTKILSQLKKIRKRSETRKNAGDKAAIVSSFAFDGLKILRESSRPITKQRKLSQARKKRKRRVSLANQEAQCAV